MESFNKNRSIAVSDAYTMLQYAASKGSAIDKTVIEQIVNAKAKVDDLSLSANEEVEFWNAFSSISKSVGTATLDCMFMKTDHFFEKNFFGINIKWRIWSPAKRSVFYYSLATLVFLVLFLVVQSYSFFGTSMLSDATRISKEIYTIDQKSGNRTPEESLELKNLQIKEKALYNALALWNKKAKIMVMVFFRFDEGLSEETTKPEGGNSSTRNIDSLMLQQVLAEYTIKALSSYSVPMICGVLGVLSYILRRISVTLEDNTFTQESRIRLRLRIPLGCLAGAMAGFLFTPTANPSIASALPPIGLSFAFGYSVEIFFSVLDNILSTMTKSTKSATVQ